MPPARRLNLAELVRLTPEETADVLKEAAAATAVSRSHLPSAMPVAKRTATRGADVRVNRQVIDSVVRWLESSTFVPASIVEEMKRGGFACGSVAVPPPQDEEGAPESADEEDDSGSSMGSFIVDDDDEIEEDDSSTESDLSAGEVERLAMKDREQVVKEARAVFSHDIPDEMISRLVREPCKQCNKIQLSLPFGKNGKSGPYFCFYCKPYCENCGRVSGMRGPEDRCAPVVKGRRPRIEELLNKDTDAQKALVWSMGSCGACSREGCSAHTKQQNDQKKKMERLKALQEKVDMLNAECSKFQAPAEPAGNPSPSPMEEEDDSVIFLNEEKPPCVEIIVID